MRIVWLEIGFDFSQVTRSSEVGNHFVFEGDTSLVGEHCRTTGSAPKANGWRACRTICSESRALRNSSPTRQTRSKSINANFFNMAICSATDSVPSSRISPIITALCAACTVARLSRAAAILVGLALYASSIKMLRSVFSNCERLF